LVCRARGMPNSKGGVSSFGAVCVRLGATIWAPEACGFGDPQGLKPDFHQACPARVNSCPDPNLLSEVTYGLLDNGSLAKPWGTENVAPENVFD
jgi:hypothetical protein